MTTDPAAVAALARALRQIAYPGYADEMAEPMEVGDLSDNGYATSAELAADILAADLTPTERAVLAAAIAPGVTVRLDGERLDTTLDVALMEAFHALGWCKWSDPGHDVAHDEEDEDGFRRDLVGVLRDHIARAYAATPQPAEVSCCELACYEDPGCACEGCLAAPARVSYLVQSDFDRLEDWCRLVRVIFQGANPYLVGSATQRPDYRDVDIRVILTDATFDLYQRTRPERIRYLNRAISVWGQQETGLPIDFQVQRQSEANAEFTGTRSPMGTRDWRSIPTSGVPAATPDAQPAEEEGR